MGFKMKGFSGFKNSPAKHTTKREGHEDSYGKGHDNSAHPEYWKVKKKTVTRSDANPDYDETNILLDHVNYDPDYSVKERINPVDEDVYLSRKDMEIQTTKNKKAGKTYTGTNVYRESPGDKGYTSTNKASRVGKTDRNTYNTGSKSKSKSKKKNFKTKVKNAKRNIKGLISKSAQNIKSKITFWNPND